MNRSVLLLFTLLFSASFSFCQDFPLIHYTIEDGLPSNNVYDIYRDNKGYLWISTDKGVARYNGNTFEIFTTDDGLPDNEVFFTTEDCNGRLWLATYNGKLCYYKEGVFHTEANTPFLKWPLNTTYLKRVYDEFDSSVTITFNEQFKFVNIVKNKVRLININFPDSIIHNHHTYAIKKTSNYGFKVSFAFVDFYTDSNGKIIETYLHPETPLKASYQSQHKTYIIDENSISYNNGQKLANISRYHFTRFNLWRVYFDKKNKFYATRDGLIVNDSIQILKGENVSSVNQDNTGNYWIGTLNNGIYSGYFNARVYKNSYQGNIKYSCSRNGRIYFASDLNKLYKLDKTGAITCLFDYEQYSHKKSDPKAVAFYYLDTSGKYYTFYGTDHLVINNVDANVKVVNAYKNIVGFRITSVFPTSHGVYFQGIRNFMNIDYNKLRTGEDISAFYNNMPNPADPPLIFAGASKGNAIWYSAADNIYKIEDGKTSLLPQFKKIGLKYFNFFGKYLVGYTYSNQLLICSDINGNVKKDTVSFQNCIWNKLYKIDDYHILASTNNLYRVLTIDTSSSTPKIRTFVIENPYLPLQAECICTDHENCSFFKNGTITSIETKKLFLQPAPPKLYFQTLKTRNMSAFADTGLTIAYNETENLSLFYSTVAFGCKKVFCQYSITKNESDNWQGVEGGEINLNNLGFGKFTIKLRAKTLSSDYSDPVIFRLTIVKPFWATWWFIILAVILAACLITVIVVYRVKYVILKKQNAHNNEIKYIRSEFKSLNALMNPHFIFNTLNNVQSLFNGNEKRAANEYLRIFADLIRQNMHNISKELITLQKEMALVANYLILEKLRFEDQLNYNIDINTDTDLSEIMVPPLLIQPLVENSIKHGILPKGGSGNINIHIFEVNELLHIQIKDDGVSMNAPISKTETNHESFGVNNIKQRIAHLSILQNKNIEFKTGEERDDKGNLLWTVITISIPV